MALKFKCILFILLGFAIRSTAQEISILGSINYLSNGLNVGYRKAFFNKKWSYQLSARIMINTFSLNGNEQEFLYYQNGYAYSFGEHLGAVGSLSRDFYFRNNSTVSLFSSLMFTYHGLKRKSDETKFYNPLPPDVPALNIYCTSPALSMELVIGPEFTQQLSDKIKFKLKSGLGLNIMFYDRISKSLITGNTSQAIISGWNKKWYYGIVGRDGPKGWGIPMMALGFTYSLKK